MKVTRKRPGHGEKMRAYWASLSPDERRQKTANARAVATGGGVREVTKRLNALSEAAFRAVDILQSTDDPRLRCAVAAYLLATGLGRTPAVARESRPANLVRVTLRDGTRVYADVSDLWRGGIGGAAIPSRLDSGALVSESGASGVCPWFVASQIEKVENLV